MEKIDPLEILERLAENGTAQEEGCSLFGTGYEEAFDRLRRVYIERAFARGRSSEKFIVGPYGSGKTHFLRQLMEMAREADCVTAEVALNKEIDFTQPMVVYREVARELRPPGDSETGIRCLFEACLARVMAPVADNREMAKRLAYRWIDGLEQTGLREPTVARVAAEAFRASLSGDVERFSVCSRWLSGEVSDRQVAKEVGTSTVAKAEQARFGRYALLSLCQLIKHAGFTGTIVGLDEAEQSFSVSKRKMQSILSMLQSSINATADLRRGAVLFCYALVPDVVEQMEDFAALQQRVADPGPDQGFFDGYTHAPKIDLTLRRGDTLEELCRIATRLVELLYEVPDWEAPVSKEAVIKHVEEIASEVANADGTASNRRTLTKRVSSMLVHLYDNGTLDLPEMSAGGLAEPEADPEV